MGKRWDVKPEPVKRATVGYRTESGSDRIQSATSEDFESY